MTLFQRTSFCLLLVYTALCWGCIGQNGAADSRIAPLLEGMGDHSFAITTNDSMAQKFFDQGLILAYGFNHKEAARSFQEVARRDSNCAMAYWGHALVLGPNINSAMDPADAPAAYEAAQKAMALARKASEKEQALIAALTKRYAADPPQDRTALDVAYADAMRQVYHKYPNDVDVAALFAESLMDLHPWDYWEKSGEAKPWTPEILAVLEHVHSLDSEHPGANHFYIHAVEASKSPDRGLPAAQRLEAVVPGAGHLVHMPSHIYIRTGRYHEGSLANERAIQSDNEYVTQCRRQGIYPLAYVPHNHHFLWATATLEGDSEKAIAAAWSTSGKVDTSMMRAPGLGTLQHFRYIPLYAYVRFGKWDEILAFPEPAEDLVYPRGIWHYARGIAFARTERFDESESELAKVHEILQDPRLEQVTIWETNTTVELIGIASNALAGEIAAARGDYDTAISNLKKAIEIEDGLTYQEPPDWFFPVRHSLGAVLLEAGRPVEAEQVYRADLETFPNNGWSLFGLKQSLEMQEKNEEASRVSDELKEAWAHADIELTSSRL